MKKVLDGDHPHACGDKRCERRLINSAEGSSHACGDKDLYYRRYGKWILSSPRVWRQGLSDEYLRYKAPIIPTRVGTSTDLCKDLR